MQQQIHVDVAPDGSLRIDAVGFTGAGCEQATAFLEEALGEVTGKQRKPEYFRRQTTRSTQRQRLGR